MYNIKNLFETEQLLFIVILKIKIQQLIVF
jgi:hypothetical protein